MKTKLLFLTLAIFISNLIQSQNGFKIYENSSPLIVTKDESNKEFYDTANWQAKEEYVKLITIKEEEIKKLKYDSGNPSTENSIDTGVVNYYSKLKVLKNELRDLKNKRDIYYQRYMKEYIENNNSNFFDFGRNRSRAFYDVLYDNDNDNSSFRALTSTGFNIGDSSGALYSELASDYLWVFRVSLTALVTASSKDDIDDESNDEAFQRLISSGGNTVLKLEYPLAYYHNDKKSFNFISIFNASGTADFKQFGTETEDWAGSFSFGVDAYLDLATTENKFRFFAESNLKLINGNSEFENNLGISGGSFTFCQFKAGLIYDNTISLSFVIGTLSSEKTLENRSVIAGGQILN